jgi:dihydroorotase/N-acyl-D-amino-acid deacylase
MRLTLSALTLLALSALPAAAQRVDYDLLIRRGRIIDGTGAPWYAGDIAIKDGRIAAIGRLDGASAGQVVDAGGRVVAPGFIDMLGQSETSVLVSPQLPSKIFQGITTEFTGEGGSAAPLTDALVKADQVFWDHFGVTPDWRSFKEYFARLEKQGIGINLGSYVGATQVRRVILGDADRTPTPEQLDSMRALVRAAMLDGAVGLSTSLQYPPAPYAKTGELVALAKEAARFGGSYATHLRSEGNRISQAIDEAVTIGREADIPVEIWHLKAAGKKNWGRMPEIVAKIDSARRAGVDIAADTYAYPAWFNSMSAFVPPWALDGGTASLVERLRDPAARKRIRRDMLTPSDTWDNEWQEIPGPESVLISVVQNPALRQYQGKTLAEVAALRKKDAIETLLDILAEDEAYTYVAVFGMSERDIAVAIEQPWVSINNDSQGTSPEGPLGKEHPHPRAYGTFPRILRKYVREEKRLSLEEAIRKFTSLPAGRMRVGDRGVLKVGMWADVVVFDPDSVRDKATFAEPNQLSEGMTWVLVNGVPVIADGKATGALPGKVLRGSGAVRLAH